MCTIANAFVDFCRRQASLRVQHFVSFRQRPTHCRLWSPSKSSVAGSMRSPALRVRDSEAQFLLRQALIAWYEDETGLASDMRLQAASAATDELQRPRDARLRTPPKPCGVTGSA